MGHGVEIMDTVTKDCKVERMGDYRFKITLTEGMNRQIRKMCAAFGYVVYKLERVRIMNLELGDLEYGEWRDLTEDEIVKLKDLTKDSVKTAE